MGRILTKIGVLTLIILMSFATDMSAQKIKSRKDLDKKSLKKYKNAISEGRKSNFEKSLKLYDQVLKKHPEFIDAQLRKSGMLHNMKDYSAAVDGFEKAIAMAPEYDPQMYYSLAIVHRDMKNFDLSAQNFQFYIDRSTDEKIKARAVDLRDRVAFAHHAITNPVPFDPIRVEGGVSSEHSEYVPLINLEGDRLIFTRRVNQQEDFYIVEIKNGEFVRVAEISDMNTPQNEGIHTMSADGRVMIFTACDRRKTGVGSCDLYYAMLDKEYWSIPSNMGKVVNSINWDAQPSLSADGKKLFFSSNRQDGYGKNDIWMSTRTDTSAWTLPVVLPDHINTFGNEESPFIHPDGHTLYFRSDQHIGMGGYDIFYTRYVDSTDTWGPVTNLGYPINTEGDEGALSVSLDGKTAFFASDMAYLDDKANANLDIYTFELYEEARPILTTFIKANITDKITGKTVRAKYTIQPLINNFKSISGRADKRGTFINSLPTNTDYAFFVEMDGYILYSENISISGVRGSVDPYVLEIELTPVPESVAEVSESNEPVVLNNIFFETGSSDLKPESDIEISRLANNLMQNESLKIQIGGHTDNVGSDIDNLKLSEQRAKSVMDALVSKGVEANRITYIGYGETKPIASNETEEGRRTNRRTEFVLK